MMWFQQRACQRSRGKFLYWATPRAQEEVWRVDKCTHAVGSQPQLTLLAALSDPHFSSLIKRIRTDSCGSPFILEMMSLRVYELLRPTSQTPPALTDDRPPSSCSSQFEVD